MPFKLSINFSGFKACKLNKQKQCWSVGVDNYEAMEREWNNERERKRERENLWQNWRKNQSWKLFPAFEKKVVFFFHGLGDVLNI